MWGWDIYYVWMFQCNSMMLCFCPAGHTTEQHSYGADNDWSDSQLDVQRCESL